MTMALKNSIHCTCRQPLNQQRNLIDLGTFSLLESLLLPYTIGIISCTVIPSMTEQNNHIRSLLLQPSATLDYNRNISLELISWKQVLVECTSSLRGLSCCYSNNSDFYARFSSKYRFTFLQGKEILFSLF